MGTWYSERICRVEEHIIVGVYIYIIYRNLVKSVYMYSIGTWYSGRIYTVEEPGTVGIYIQ